MKNRTLLFVIDQSTPESAVEALGEQARSQNARVICLLLALTPVYPYAGYGGIAYAPQQTDDWAAGVEKLRQAAARRCGEIEAVMERAGIIGSVQALLCGMADVRDEVARRALICDIASIAPNLREDDPDIFRAAAHGILFASPAALFLNRPALDLPGRVFVGWNGSLPAARAIHAARPLLANADEVVIGVFDPGASDGENPGSDLAEWLSHLGCNVTVNQYPSGGELVGEAMRKRATELGSDLVVMGAYGRSRIRELVFGGSTRTMLNQDRVPVLMAH